MIPHKLLPAGGAGPFVIGDGSLAVAVGLNKENKVVACTSTDLWHWAAPVSVDDANSSLNTNMVMGELYQMGNVFYLYCRNVSDQTTCGYKSTDGVSWEKLTLPWSASYADVTEVEYFGWPKEHRFFYLKDTSNAYWYSTDLVSWNTFAPAVNPRFFVPPYLGTLSWNGDNSALNFRWGTADDASWTTQEVAISGGSVYSSGFWCWSFGGGVLYTYFPYKAAQNARIMKFSISPSSISLIGTETAPWNYNGSLGTLRTLTKGLAACRSSGMASSSDSTMYVGYKGVSDAPEIAAVNMFATNQSKVDNRYLVDFRSFIPATGSPSAIGWLSSDLLPIHEPSFAEMIIPTKTARIEGYSAMSEVIQKWLGVARLNAA